MHQPERVGILIQARMGSKRFPGKALAPICGKPLLERLCHRMSLCQRADELIVATSDQPQDDAIEEACSLWQVRSFRGPEKDLTARLLGAADAHGLTAFVRVTGDNPLTDPTGIDELIAALKREQTVHGSKPILVHNMHSRGYPYGTGAEAATRSVLERCDRELWNPDDREYFASYAKEHPQQFHCVKIEAKANLQRPEYFLTMDTAEDLEMLSAIYANVRGEDRMSLGDIIQFLDTNPELAKSNAHLHEPFAA